MGTDLYMPGLLANEDEIGTNVPQARFGNLSAFAKDGILSKQGNGVRRPCHLGDMRSRTDFSGLPVIVYIETTALDGKVDVKNRLLRIHE
ncbi:MAG: hypothetical protein QOF22_384 [Bradyrhizobium sp.]|jgi:hypothetical protein|nr:hypothetical protein [Bradyrhizobium sp.]